MNYCTGLLNYLAEKTSCYRGPTSGYWVDVCVHLGVDKPGVVDGALQRRCALSSPSPVGSEALLFANVMVHLINIPLEYEIIVGKFTQVEVLGVRHRSVAMAHQGHISRTRAHRSSPALARQLLEKPDEPTA